MTKLWRVESIQGADGIEESHILPVVGDEVEAGHERAWHCPCRPNWEQEHGERLVQHKRLRGDG